MKFVSRATCAIGLGLLAALALAGAAQATKPSERPMVLAPSKPNGSGIAVRYRVEGVPAAGQAVSVVLDFSGARSSAEPAKARFSADEGLRIQSGGEQIVLGSGTTRHLVQVIPQRDGLFYLNVFTEQAGASSATAIAIQVGQAAQKVRSAGEPKTTPSGERIISLPVK